MEKENAFLDTSVIISKEFGSQDIKSRISDTIENLNKHTTTFAVMEINCSLLKDAIFLYSLLIEEMDLAMVFHRLQKYPLTSRRRIRCLEVLERITNKRQLRLADAITRLESLITGLHLLLLKDVNLLKSKTNCPLAEAKIEKVNQIYKISLSCRRKSAKCDLDQFLRGNRTDIIKISTQISFDPKLSNLFKKIFDNLSFAKGRNCSKLGDVIICLESPNSHTIYSTNPKDFEPICKALKKKFVGIR